MKEFYINLPSNTLSKFNTTAQFRAKLPKDVKLVGDWEVALVEMQHPYSWNNVPDEVEYSEEYLCKNEFLVADTETKAYQVIKLWPGFYQTPDDLVAVIHECSEDTKFKGRFALGYDYIQKRMRVKVVKGTAVLFSTYLQYFLGFENRRITSNALAKYPIDFQGGIDSLFVYCDICEPQIVGDSMQPLLRIVPVSGEYGSSVHNVFVAPHYIGVLNKEFSSIEITIKTDQNITVPFLFGKCVVKLHFRQK